jgi:hypothetical protein
MRSAQLRIFLVHGIEQLLHVGGRIRPKLHAGLAEFALWDGSPWPVFGEKACKPWVS